MAKIGLLGGTFDPIHNGHLHLGISSKNQLGLSEVVYIPAGNPPHKTSVRTDNEHRLNMIKLAISGEAGLSVSDYEIKKKTRSYSVETIEHFINEFPEDEFVFILGEDSLDYIESWHDAKRLLTICPFAVLKRGGYETGILEKIRFLEEKYGADISLIEVEKMEISSSKIREMVSLGEDIGDFVSYKVKDYIEKNGLYKNAEE